MYDRITEAAVMLLAAHQAQFPNVPMPPVLTHKIVGENVEFYVSLEPAGGIRGWLAANAVDDDAVADDAARGSKCG